MLTATVPVSWIIFTVASLVILPWAQRQCVEARPSQPPPCRWASRYTTKSILEDPARFENDLLQWEGMFHQDNVSYNAFNGMTFDGTLLDPVTGIHVNSGLHTFSAASKESLHMMLLAHVVNGHPGAAQWILAAHGGGSDVEKARSLAINILQTKWNTYFEFNATYPGFGGFLPWFAHNGSAPLAPTWDWVNRVPGLDNGENIWAISAVIEALELTGRKNYQQLANNWQTYLDFLKTTALKIFYRGNGHICAVTDIANQSLPVDHPSQSYVCEGANGPGNPYLNDPYEGQQFMWFLFFFGGLSQTEKDAIWAFKRPQLVSVDWTEPGFSPVTVQKGFWFSSHENWGFMELPYTDVPLMKNLYTNMERARTCDSFSKQNPGMYASVNNSTDSNGQIIGCELYFLLFFSFYFNAGNYQIFLMLVSPPSLTKRSKSMTVVITPYSTMNTMIVNKPVGLAWWHNMVVAKRMQNPYGSSESTRMDGTATSAFVSWDSKVTTVNGILGGVSFLVRSKMQREGIYDEFIEVVQREWGAAFGNGALRGQEALFCLPAVTVPDGGLQDFTACA
ncbi:putative GPI anchored protein [Hysterangium stoloniferum]|nr:putative GPI anchored protein [Hysterangium stoloniferum]